MADGDNENDAAQVYLLGKTQLANNQGQFYIRNDPIVQMAAGDRHTIIITESGRAFAFGDNSSGQLGLGHTNNIDKVSCIKSLKFGNTGEKIILAACGRESSLVATNRGAIYAFGSNIRSQLGLESPSVQAQPTKIEQFRGLQWKQIAMGAEHACALTEDGQVYVWGSNEDGQCGQLKAHDVIKTPRELRIEFVVVSISCGYYHTAFVSDEGRLYLCGNNDDRQLGRKLPDQFSGPMEVSIPGFVKAVACGHQHTVVLTDKGDVLTCGHGARGQLGLGHRVHSAETFEVVQIFSKHLIAISAGEGHTAVLGARGDLYIFGDGKHGKLGSPTHSNEFDPCHVDKFKAYQVFKVVCGGCQTIVLAQKKSLDQKRSSASEEDTENMTLSITQRPKSRARATRNKSIVDRSHNISDSIDTNLRQVRPVGVSPHLRVEPDPGSDGDKSDRELSESLKSATFNQTHTLTNGKLRPTQGPPLNRGPLLRSDDDDTKILRTGALDRTVRMNRETGELTKTSNQLPSLDRSPIRGTQFDRSNPPIRRRPDDSDEEKTSSEEEFRRQVGKKPEQVPSVRTDRVKPPEIRRRDNSESDENSRKRLSPVKTPMSERLDRKPAAKPIRRSDLSDGDDDEEQEYKSKNPPLSNRQNKTQLPLPPPITRRGSLPSQTRPLTSNLTPRDPSQTIGSKPVDGVRGSFRSPATKTLAKPVTNTPSNETPAPQPGFFARIFGSKSTPPPPPPAPAPAAAPTTSNNSRTCSIM